MTEIVLTRDGRGALFLLVVSLLAAYNTGANLVFLMAAVIMATLLSSAFYAPRQTKSLSYRISGPKVAAQDNPIELTIHLANEGKRPRYFLSCKLFFLSNIGKRVQSQIYDGALPKTLEAGKESSAQIKLCFPLRGAYRLEKVLVESSYPMGLLKHQRSLEGQELTIVTLARASDFTCPGITSHEQESDCEDSRLSKRGEGDSFYGLREYRKGDPLKTVHWKSSARRGKLLVQEFQEYLTARYYIYLDLDGSKLRGKGKKSNLEISISICARLCLDLARNRNFTQVLIYQDDLSLSPPIFTASDIHLVLRFLGRVSYTSSSVFERLIERSLPAIEPNSFLVFVVVDPRKKLIEKIYKAAKTARSTTVILNTEGLSDSERERIQGILPLSREWGIRFISTSRRSSGQERFH